MTLWDACGNRLVVVVEPADDAQLENAHSVAQRCWRDGTRIADGVAWFAPRDGFFRTAFFNPDGSLERLCGNSLLVAAQRLGNGSPVRVRPFDYPPVEVHASVSIQASAKIPFARVMRKECAEGRIFDTGSPHLVIQHEDVENADIHRLAPPLVESLDVNVTMFSLSGNTARVRTFERGVNAETLACGTGALAVALAVGRAVDIRYPGGAYQAAAQRSGADVSWILSTSKESVRLADP